MLSAVVPASSSELGPAAWPCAPHEDTSCLPGQCDLDLCVSWLTVESRVGPDP